VKLGLVCPSQAEMTDISTPRCFISTAHVCRHRVNGSTAGPASLGQCRAAAVRDDLITKIEKWEMP
jgi:hypothetical protein